MTKQQINIFWFRRDLRLEDNNALFHALKSSHPIVPIFIFDRNILDKLIDNGDNKEDPRVEFIYLTLAKLQHSFTKIGSSLEVYHGTPLEVFKLLINKYDISEVYANHDYDTYAKERELLISDLLCKEGIQLKTFKDHVIFEKNEIMKPDGRPYTVFTPYSKTWKAAFTELHIKPYDSQTKLSYFFKQEPQLIPSLSSLGFRKTNLQFPEPNLSSEMLLRYNELRNYPGVSGTSRIGLHLRFGTLSIRLAASYGKQSSQTFLNELIWRDFYQMILWYFPHVGEGRAFKPAYDNIDWLNDEVNFKKWCAGQTGYPIVDAGMRELNTTGYMHNRVRMIVASFLSKHLLLDWRWGEAYFAAKLLDFDLASNNGGWQWASGSGCDAAPYFRIFNPYLQTKKFDPEYTYIKKWVPELADSSYPKPIVDHDLARKRCLEAYKKGLNRNSGTSKPISLFQ